MIRPLSRVIYAVVGILILLTGVRAYADTSIDASDRETRIKLIPGMNILPDPSGVLTIEDILEPAHQVRFKPITGIGVNLGIVSHPYWFRVVLRNDSEFVRQKALELNNPRLSEVQFFGINSDGVLDKDRAGVLVPESAARWTTPEPAFPLNLLPGGEHTVYLRVDHHGGLRFGANLWERRDYRRHSGVVIGLCAFFVGAIAMVALYNLVVFLDLRERAYLYLALLSVVLCVYVLSKNGFARVFLWGAWPWWADRADMALLAVLMALTILFADTFLEGARIAPRLSRAIQFLAFLLLLEVPLCALDTPIKYYVIHISGLVGITATGFLAGYAIRAGYAPARPFLRALAPTALGVVILSLLGPGLLPTTTFTEYGVELCFMLTGALWLQSLTSRLRNQEAEHRETLEVRVSERTADLSKALAEVKTLSGLLPMCSGCKKIRDDKGYWNGVEAYIEDRSDAMFSHGLCPDCVHEFFSEYFDPDEKIDG